jgi:uracil-DNA glycosylase
VRIQIDQISREITALESQGLEVLPAPQNVFRALQIAPSDVAVVIVGQDPYPNRLHACGLSFSVPAGTLPLPGSLRNILKEVISDTGQTQVTSGDLQPWVDQGVMLLNRTLTVTLGESNAHKDFGWGLVTDRIIDIVVAHNPDVVAVLWGNHAQRLKSKFNQSNVVLGVHPSPLSAHRGFFGSRPFSAANQILKTRQIEPIQW